MRPWSPIPIHDCAEGLVELPPELLRIEPHPYAVLGAPYGTAASPFRLRQAVVQRLLRAQEALQASHPGWRLAIFDAWRPVAVQAFMVEHAIGEECGRRGVDRLHPSAEREAVIEAVGQFWATPSLDPATPPPHSTGGAVDLTLATRAGVALDMGSSIDAIGSVSEPDHFLARAQQLPEGAGRASCLQWHQRRCALRDAMALAGFAQHPNEWWHFSWGDQLWAWRTGQGAAVYGRAPEPG
jgi:D-alanyl-D-alanine dipeptidase